TLCTVVDSLGRIGRGKATDKRRRLLLGKGGAWERAERITSHLTAQGVENAADEGADEDGYFVPTGGASDSKTYQERRERTRESFKLLALQTQISKREPDWKFADHGTFICNVLSLSSSKIQKGFNIHLTKEYFERKWTDKFAKKVQTKRDMIDKQTKDAVRTNAVGVGQRTAQGFIRSQRDAAISEVKQGRRLLCGGETENQQGAKVDSSVTATHNSTEKHLNSQLRHCAILPAFPISMIIALSSGVDQLTGRGSFLPMGGAGKERGYLVALRDNTYLASESGEPGAGGALGVSAERDSAE
ncbi:hypothetical protein THAOC_28373, partial [Thalassiosira oceanica]